MALIGPGTSVTRRLLRINWELGTSSWGPKELEGVGLHGAAEMRAGAA